MWEIYEVLGIEATRQFLLEEYTDVVSSDGTFINSCHIELLVDIMTSFGSINSIRNWNYFLIVNKICSNIVNNNIPLLSNAIFLSSWYLLFVGSK